MVKGGDPVSIKRFYEQYKQDVYRYAVHLTGDAMLAEDLVSETFLSAMAALPRFKGTSDVKTWLFSIARHKWYEHLRKRRANVPLDELAHHYLTVDAPEDIVVQRALYERTQRCLQQEPQRTQSIIRLRIQGYSYREIAQQHNISEASARVIDFRAKRKIRTLLEEEGLDYE